VGSARSLLLALLLGLLAACSTAQQKVDEGALYQYRADIDIAVDGRTFKGMGVTLLDRDKSITFTSRAPLDVITISSCHRQEVYEKEAKDWKGDAGFVLPYVYDANDIEKDGVCPIYVKALSENGLAAWGYLAFRSPSEAYFPAHIDCNGAGTTFAGVSVCQTKAGLRQRIEFDRDVKFTAEPACHIDALSARAFDLSSDLGFCYATFIDEKTRSFHYLILLGYDKVFVRGGN
jgi:hypothetical protein